MHDNIGFILLFNPDNLQANKNNWTKQNKTKQNKTKQNKTKQKQTNKQTNKQTTCLDNILTNCENV